MAESRPDIVNRVSDRVKYAIERLLVRGAQYRLLFVAVMIGLLSVIGGVLAMIGSGREGLATEIWWAFLRLSDPGYLGDDEGYFRRTVSTGLTVLGYVVFLGALVAIMTQWLNATMARLESGLTPVAKNNHFLVLGWNSRTASIVRELFLSGRRVRRFLQRRGARSLNVVILAENVNAALRQDLRDRVGDAWDEHRVVLRSGTPLRAEHLERVDFANAAAILLPSADFSHGGTANMDARTIKTLLSLSQSAPVESGRAPPLAVAEVLDTRKVPVAKRAYRGPIEVIASDAVISRLLAQNVRHPGLSDVYNELLTHGVGNEIYIRDANESAGRTFGDLAAAFPRAIPLGIVRPGESDFEPLLNPAPGSAIGPDDRLVLLAERYEDTDPVSAEARPAHGPGAPRARAAGDDSAQHAPRRVLVLGWSHKVPALVRELGTYDGEAFEVDIVSTAPIERRGAILERYLPDLPRLGLQQVQADYTVLHELRRMDPAGYHAVILVASESAGSGEESDARSILGYLLLQELLAGAESTPTVIVELLDPENVSLLDMRGGEILISPLILSHLLAQIALRRELRAVFDELFTAGGPEIGFEPAAAFGLTGREVTFAEVQSAAGASGRIALGFSRGARSGASDRRTHLNPGRFWRGRLDDAYIVTLMAGGSPDR